MVKTWFASAMVSVVVVTAAACGSSDTQSVLSGNQPALGRPIGSLPQCGGGLANAVLRVTGGAGVIAPFDKWLHLPAGTVVIGAGALALGPTAQVMVINAATSPQATLDLLDSQLRGSGFSQMSVANPALTPAAENLLSCKPNGGGSNAAYVDRFYQNGKTSLSFETTAGNPSGTCIVFQTTQAP